MIFCEIDPGRWIDVPAFYFSDMAKGSAENPKFDIIWLFFNNFGIHGIDLAGSGFLYGYRNLMFEPSELRFQNFASDKCMSCISC